jgi:hypothetical protein
MERLKGIASLADVTIQVSGGLLRVGRIPLAALQHFVHALRGLDLASAPSPASKKRAKARR